MITPLPTLTSAKPVHPWLRSLRLHFAPGHLTPLLESLSADLLDAFRRLGHTVQDKPTDDTDFILATAPFGEVLNWRQSLLFTARRRFKLSHLPTIYTLIHATPAQFDAQISHFERALAKTPPDPQDFSFPGLAPASFNVLIEQGLRGGPILSLMRLVQTQAKSIRILLAIGDDHPERLYHFDLAGAFPYSDWSAGPDAFYEDVALRITTYQSTREITAHEVVGEPIPHATWTALSTPAAMIRAAREIGRRNFFTDTIRIEDLAAVPAVAEAVARQYSEGCFATWDPQIEALIATITGSARPVDKDNITDAELAVITGVRADGSGALTRHVEGKPNDPPSSEAVEMMDMDYPLPQIRLPAEWGIPNHVPVVRSKLHGHRGVRAYNPALVEYVPMDAPYFHYLVSCATEAQARGIKAAFARSESSLNPADPRQVAFTILPGHGVVITEKWVSGKVPFQTIWEYMDSGHLQIDNHVPQGPFSYQPLEDGLMVIQSKQNALP